MQNRWSIREAEAGDAQLVLEMIKALAEYERLADEVTATAENIEQTLLQPRSQAKCLLAFVQEQPAGFAVFFCNYSTFQGKYGIYLEDLFVKPEFRGFGIGKSLLETIIRRAKNANYRRVEWSVLDWNQPAIEFYQKLGAQPLKEWVKFRINLD